MQPSENFVITKNSKLMIFVKTVSSIFALLLFAFYTSVSNENINEIGLFFLENIIFFALGIILITLILIIFYFLDWKVKTLYQYSDRLLYEKGIINKVKTTLRYEKISTVDIYRPLLYRIFGLSQLKIDSNTVAAANAGKSEIVIILSKDIAVQKKTELLNVISAYEAKVLNKEPVSSTNQNSLLVLTSGKIILMIFLSFMMGLILTIPFAVSGLFTVLVPVLQNAFPGESVAADVILYFIIAVLGFFAFLCITGIISSVLMYHKFTLLKSPGKLHLSYGLVDIKNVTVPFHKINGIRLNQNLLQRIFRLYSVSLLTASYGDEKNELSSVIAPSATREEAIMIIKQIYGDLPDFTNKIKPKGTAFILYFFPALFFAVLSALSVYLNAPFISVAGFGGTIVVVCLIAGILQYANTGISCENGYYRLDKGGIFRSIVILPSSRCQMVSMRRGPIQRLFGKGTLTLNLFSSMVKGIPTISIRHMNKKLAEEFFELK